METTISKIEINGKVISELSGSLKSKGFKTVLLFNEQQVIDFIHHIPNDKIIGLGDSITTCSLKIRNILARKGRIIFHGWNGDTQYNRTMDTFEDHPLPDYYLTRVNAITRNGRILLKDYSRQAAMENYFPKHIIAFTGSNRIVEDFSNTSSIQKYTVIKEKPPLISFTVVFLPFMEY
jgi:hypothetical protein